MSTVSKEAQPEVGNLGLEISVLVYRGTRKQGKGVWFDVVIKRKPLCKTQNILISSWSFSLLTFILNLWHKNVRSILNAFYSSLYPVISYNTFSGIRVYVYLITCTIHHLNKIQWSHPVWNYPIMFSITFELQALFSVGKAMWFTYVHAIVFMVKNA